MIQRSKEKQQNVDEDDIEKNPSSTFFYETTFNMGMSNSMEWSQIYTFFKKGDFTKEYDSYVDDLVDTKGS
jgi:hypothetical protein